MLEAKGYFEIEMKPEATFGEGIGRFSISKVFRGDLDATGTGGMFAVRTRMPGSAGYVLIEQIDGTLNGRSGSFMLQHHGLMDRGRPEQIIVVIPDSGTGALEGIEGQMSIDAADNHAYVLTYTLPARGA